MACKPDSVPRVRGDDHSSCPAVAGRVMLPTRVPEPKRVHARPLFGIAPGEACRAGSVASPAVSSYLTVSPLPRWRGRLFSVALSLGLPRPGVTRHLRSVESGLSSKPWFRGHPAIRNAPHMCFALAKQASRAAVANEGLLDESARVALRTPQPIRAWLFGVWNIPSVRSLTSAVPAMSNDRGSSGRRFRIAVSARDAEFRCGPEPPWSFGSHGNLVPKPCRRADARARKRKLGSGASLRGQESPMRPLPATLVPVRP